MTFEDFINQERPWLQNLNQIEQYKLVWNAAIEASLLAAASAPAAPMGMSVWEQVEGQIKKLLTA